MKFKFILLLTFLALAGFHLKAQDFLVKGVVFERGTNIRVALAVITNTRTQLAVGSNDMGFFQLKAAIGDTLLITKRNLQDQTIIVQDQRDLIVYLLRGSTTLDEVTIRGNTKKEDLAEIRRDFQNKGVYNGGKSSFLSSIFQPLNGIYNLFGKDPKNARRFGRYADNEIKQSEIDVYFNATIIQKNSDLKGKDLETYMLNCRPDYEKAQNWNSYDYLKYIKDSTKKFSDTLGKGGK